MHGSRVLVVGIELEIPVDVKHQSTGFQVFLFIWECEVVEMSKYGDGQPGW